MVGLLVACETVPAHHALQGEGAGGAGRRNHFLGGFKPRRRQEDSERPGPRLVLRVSPAGPSRDSSLSGCASSSAFGSSSFPEMEAVIKQADDGRRAERLAFIEKRQVRRCPSMRFLRACG